MPYNLKKIKYYLIWLLLLPVLCFGDNGVSNPPLEIREEDGSPSTYPFQIKVTNSTLTDNGDSTSSLDTSGTTTTGWTDDGSTVRLTTPTDNVGIGRSNPSAKLHIFGAGTGTTFALRIADSTPTDRLVVMDNGNVGIGTTNPIYFLQVAGTSASQTLQFGTAYNNILPAGTGANNQILKTDASGVITWQDDSSGTGTASTEGTVDGVMYLKAANTGAGASLALWDNANGQLNVGSGTTGNASTLYIRGAGTGTTFALRIANTTPTDRLVVLDNGNVGIGTTAPVALLQVAGTSPAVQNLTVLSNGNVGIGTTAPARRLQVVGDYARIGDGGTITYADGDGDLYVEDELEVAGEIRVTYGIYAGLWNILDNVNFIFGSGSDSTLRWLTTGNDFFEWKIKTGTDADSGNIIICDNDNVSWGHPIVVDPHLRIQSGDDTSVNDYIQFWHDQTDANIQTGSGRLKITSGSTAPTDLLYIRSAGTGTNMALRIANTTPTDILAVLDNQRVGIGTTLPTARLEILPSDTTPAQTLYVNFAGSGIVFKSPDSSCSLCSVDNADVFSCSSVTCP